MGTRIGEFQVQDRILTRNQWWETRCAQQTTEYRLKEGAEHTQQRILKLELFQVTLMQPHKGQMKTQAAKERRQIRRLRIRPLYPRRKCQPKVHDGGRT